MDSIFSFNRNTNSDVAMVKTEGLFLCSVSVCIFLYRLKPFKVWGSFSTMLVTFTAEVGKSTNSCSQVLEGPPCVDNAGGTGDSSTSTSQVAAELPWGSLKLLTPSVNIF